MYRIRLHGRGGQGMKTAGRVLGTAFFLAGYEIQDAPLYGAERRGAPIFAFVRASHRTIYERGVIDRPDLVVVADDSLIPIPAAGVLNGIDKHTVLLINSDDCAELWQQRLNIESVIHTLPAQAQSRDALRFIGATCTGAAAGLLGVISRKQLQQAITMELGELGDEVLAQNLQQAMTAYEKIQGYGTTVKPRAELALADYQAPAWIDFPFEQADVSAPTIHAGATSVKIRTGLWRTLRPVIDLKLCKRCWWVCSTFCPDGVISVNDIGQPGIDYDHCKGCLICVSQCPPHAIYTISEHEAQKQEALMTAGGQT